MRIMSVMVNPDNLTGSRIAWKTSLWAHLGEIVIWIRLALGKP